MPDPSDYRPEAHGDAELIGGLEPDQLIANASKPFPRMRLGSAARAGLWVLRGFVLLISLAVLYVFVYAIVGRS